MYRLDEASGTQLRIQKPFWENEQKAGGKMYASAWKEDPLEVMGSRLYVQLLSGGLQPEKPINGRRRFEDLPLQQSAGGKLRCRKVCCARVEALKQGGPRNGGNTDSATGRGVNRSYADLADQRGVLLGHNFLNASSSIG